MKVKAVKPMSFGHTNIELEDGTFLVLTRGTPIPKVGDEYVEHVPPKAPEQPPYAHAAGKPAQPVKS